MAKVKSDLDVYLDQLKSSKMRAGAMSALGGLYNINLISQAKIGGKSEQFVAPKVEAPFIPGPGSQLVQGIYSKDINAGSNASRKILMESGNMDMIPAINAQDLTARTKVNAEAILQDYEAMGKNIIASNEASNANRAAAADAKNKNIQKTMEENLMDSQVISAGVQELFNMGQNMMNVLNTSDYYGMVARKMFDNQMYSDVKDLTDPARIQKPK